MAKVSYAILACNEAVELKKLLTQLTEHIHKDDEIVILTDADNTTNEVLHIIDNMKQSSKCNIVSDSRPLAKDFAGQKNHLNTLCSGAYIFNIDADELVYNVGFLSNIHDFIEGNSNTDVFWVPRVNVVNGITDDHIKQWRWVVNDKGWINWPDYQMRLYRNTPAIKWVNPVHEVLTGYVTYGRIPLDPDFALLHVKDIDRQEKQNQFYSTI